METRSSDSLHVFHSFSTEPVEEVSLLHLPREYGYRTILNQRGCVQYLQKGTYMIQSSWRGDPQGMPGFLGWWRCRLMLPLLLLLVTSGCSIRRYAINRIGDALASGSSTYASDEDLELVGEALPFGLKLIESLLAESPKHKGLLLAACEGFTSYTWVYVQQEGDRVAQEDLQRARHRTRARKLYLRAHRYGLRRLEASYQGIAQQLETAPQAALSVVKKEDIPALYWTAAALGLAISVSKNDAEMLARLPEVEAFLEQSLALDESWDAGALHEFQITLAGAKPGALDVHQIKKHFDRALQLSGGGHAGLYVTYAEVVSVQEQNRSEFRSLLERALAIDPAQYEEIQLLNLVAQQRARWLLGRIDELFLEEEAPDLKGGRG